MSIFYKLMQHIDCLFLLLWIDNKKKAPRCTVLYLVAAGLGIICVILVSAVVTVTIYCKSDDLLLNEGLLRPFECSGDGFLPRCSRRGDVGAAQRKHRPGGSEPAHVDREERLGAAEPGADPREGPAPLDPCCHPGL